MQLSPKRILLYGGLFFLYGFIGLLGGLVLGAVLFLNHQPELSLWHTVDLDEEFRANDVESFKEYLALEERLFAQLQTEVYDQIDAKDISEINRYSANSLADPARWDRNWNCTFELKPEGMTPVAAVLLLHGMSDSPYSLRVLGEALQARGVWVIGLRLPGHGTAPSGLIKVKWEDMAAAVQLSMEHIAAGIDGKPIAIIGYSNGAALAVNYALDSLSDDELPRLDWLVLLSPEIGVSKAASIASIQGKLGRILGMEKLAWNSVVPEYDPFKYNSFAVNAGDQAYRVTMHIRERIHEMGEEGELINAPPVLAFQSGVDATVSTPAVLKDLFAYVPENGSELVLFDVNRIAPIQALLKNDPKDELVAMLTKDTLSYALTAVTNRNADSAAVLARTHTPGRAETTEVLLEEPWPKGVYSLSHIALPFPVDDPLYGDGGTASPGIALGNLALRGERGVLAVSATDMLRLHWNPFYPYVEARIFEFLDLPPLVPEG